MMDSSKAQPAEETTAQAAPEAVDAVDQNVVDACDLAALGHDQSLTRKFDIWSILALAFCVLGTWSTFAQVSTGGHFYFVLRGRRTFSLATASNASKAIATAAMANLQKNKGRGC